MKRPRRGLSARQLAIAAYAGLVIAGCTQGTSSGRGPSPAAASRPPGSGPRHGGRALALDAAYQAELIVDGTGMIYVYLYDREWRPLETAGKRVTATVATPDGLSKEFRLGGMGSGEGAHFMGPMDAPVLAHVREQGSYTLRLRAEIEGRALAGQVPVAGLATGGRGM